MHQALFCTLLPSKHTFSQPKHKFIIASWETPFSKKSYNTETSQLIYKARPLIEFYMIRVFTEGYFGTDWNTLFSIEIRVHCYYPYCFKLQVHNSPLILFFLTECIKRAYSKHSKNTKSRSYPRFSSLREKILLGIWTCNRESTNIWHKSKFFNENFAWI